MAVIHLFFSFYGVTGPQWAMVSSLSRLDITLRHNTISRTPLDEWSARRRDLYLTKRNTRKSRTSMSLAGFAPAIPASERLQTHALDGAAAGIVFTPLIARENLYKQFYIIIWRHVNW